MLVYKYSSPREIAAHMLELMATTEKDSTAATGAARLPPELGQPLPLHFNEAGFARFWPPVSMITFFRGDADAAAELLRSRLNLVLDANPWLAGRLKRQGPGKLNLHVPDAATLEERRPACFCDTPVGDLHPGMRSDEMQSLLSPLL
eukprot:67930-Prymnesium_polylepis.1